ncbi:MAG: ACT domain-containing protein [Proteobacteria bacterium]|nr:ACT domain-containing protein [Pseudomonadota bacterium]MDA1357892.1 ACT domain-containing protein [Pseudomonadota bacterium]
MTLSLSALPGHYCVVRLDAEAALPAWFSLAAPLAAACRTADELSLLCAEEDVPAAVPAERGLRAFKVAGPLDFSQTGILAAIAGPLGAAKIPIFALSTFETDYVLVPAARFAEAGEILSQSFDVTA